MVSSQAPANGSQLPAQGMKISERLQYSICHAISKIFWVTKDRARLRTLRPSCLACPSAGRQSFGHPAKLGTRVESGDWYADDMPLNLPRILNIHEPEPLYVGRNNLKTFWVCLQTHNARNICRCALGSLSGNTKGVLQSQIPCVHLQQQAWSIFEQAAIWAVCKFCRPSTYARHEDEKTWENKVRATEGRQQNHLGLQACPCQDARQNHCPTHPSWSPPRWPKGVPAGEPVHWYTWYTHDTGACSHALYLYHLCHDFPWIFYVSTLNHNHQVIESSFNLQPLHQRKPFLHPCRPHDGHGWLMPRGFSRGFPAGPQPNQRKEGHLQAPRYLFFPTKHTGLDQLGPLKSSTNYAPWTISMHGEVWNSCTVLYYVCLEYNFVWSMKRNMSVVPDRPVSDIRLINYSSLSSLYNIPMVRYCLWVNPTQSGGLMFFRSSWPPPFGHNRTWQLRGSNNLYQSISFKDIRLGASLLTSSHPACACASSIADLNFMGSFAHVPQKPCVRHWCFSGSPD